MEAATEPSQESFQRVERQQFLGRTLLATAEILQVQVGAPGNTRGSARSQQHLQSVSDSWQDPRPVPSHRHQLLWVGIDRGLRASRPRSAGETLNPCSQELAQDLFKT